ncbi:MAG: esterase [Chrysiogenetes bacterium]|nr:esterase [Chrysiogenetes bacterium]
MNWRTRARRLTCTIAVLAAVLLLAPLTARAGGSTPPPPSNNDLGLQSGWGITVQYSFWLTERTAVVGVHTDLIDPDAVNGPHEVRITFPANYWNSGGTRYPVLYLMHGGAGGSSRQWTTEGGAAEWITRDAPLITVMPDCGKVGWFYDWPNMNQGMQAWESYHIDQLIPWVDQNLRTIARKEGRAIAGLSMGGFGAIHYAQDRPDLFAYAGSFSGAQDLEDQSIRATIVEQSIQNGYWSYPFGPVIWPFDTTWVENNPLRRADRLRTVWVALYAGDGINDQDILERTVGWSSFQLSNALDAQGIPHFWWMYGRGPGLPWGCDGGHNFNCWNFAFEHALPGMMDHLWHP